MNVCHKSNCLLGAIGIKRHMGGQLRWRPGWMCGRKGWFGFIDNPWGHFWIDLPDGSTASCSAIDKDLSVLHQLWFHGFVKIKRGDK